MVLLCAVICVFSGRISLPRLASAEVSEAGLALWAGEAARPAAEPGGGLEVILGVTTAGEPGPRSIRLSSVVSLNVWKGVGGGGGSIRQNRDERNSKGIRQQGVGFLSQKNQRKKEGERGRERRPVAAETLKGQSVFAQCVRDYRSKGDAREQHSEDGTNRVQMREVGEEGRF